MDAEARAEWQRRREQEQAAQDRERVQRLAEFSTRELWEECHRRMQEEQRVWWRQQGIADEWQEYYKLGYAPQRSFSHNGELFVANAYTIPIFDLGWKPINMQYRIENPPPGVGKYRQEAGLSAAAFLSRPDMGELGGEIIVVEGAKKAAVVCAHLSDTPQVVGLPGCSSWAGMDTALQVCERVYVVLDPGAEEAAERLAVAIGKQAVVVTIRMKPDDALLAHPEFGEKQFRQYLRYGRRITGKRGA